MDDKGRVLISTRETAIKTRNLRRDPRASLCVFTDGFFGEWVQVEGETEIISLPDAMGLLVEYYQLVSGEHPDWDDYRAAMERDRRVILRVSITRAGPDISG
jgi:PPOX class probable F420-dependent enzyme